jgi:hypothetical protein
MDSTNEVDAKPSKRFFIEMLTKDIGLQEAILDLIDNAVHGVIRSTGVDVMGILAGKAPAKRISGTIIIEIRPTRFTIQDTCGGISIDDARHEVFRFGKPEPNGDGKGLGVYGIGMKRAFFKIGNRIAVESKTTREEFALDIDAEEWLEDADNWTFAFRYARPLRNPIQTAKAGTTITITDLHENARRLFETRSFEANLVAKISKVYRLFLERGLTIRVNSATAEAEAGFEVLAASKEIGVARESSRHERVTILIIAGVTPRSDRTPRGWYVFCNGRMVLEADRSTTTGWGDVLPLWNPKFNHFLGLLLFGSDHVEELPWKTTKDGVEYEAPVYQYALGQMRTLCRPILDFLGRAYPEETLESVPEREILERAKSVTGASVAKGPDRAFRVTVLRGSETRAVSIQYVRPKADVSRIAESLGRPRLAAGKVGEFTFDYYRRNVCK